MIRKLSGAGKVGGDDVLVVGLHTLEQLSGLFSIERHIGQVGFFNELLALIAVDDLVKGFLHGLDNIFGSVSRDTESAESSDIEVDIDLMQSRNIRILFHALGVGNNQELQITGLDVGIRFSRRADDSINVTGKDCGQGGRGTIAVRDVVEGSTGLEFDADGSQMPDVAGACIGELDGGGILFCIGDEVFDGIKL